MKYFFIFFAFCLSANTTFAQDKTLDQMIKSVILGKKATVGVAVGFDNREYITINNDKEYPMLSTYKFPLALAVLDHLDKSGLTTATEIFVTKTDLLPNTYSPLRDARPKGDFNISIGELLKYSVSQSDNNACDILIRYIGGIEVFQKYVSSLGIGEMVITATEEAMHRKFENQYLNWTKPAAAVSLLEKFLKKGLLSTENQEFLEKIMIETSTGADKLKGGLPAEVIIGHKTGSSDRNKAGLKVADNDIAFVRLPNNKQYVIAVFVKDSYENDATNAAIIAGISKVVYDYFSIK